MGNDFDDTDSRSPRSCVQVVGLGVQETGNPDLRGADERVRLSRRNLLVGGTLIACVFAGLTLLPSMNDGPPPERIEPTMEAVSACSALQGVDQRKSSIAAREGSPPRRDELPPGHIITGVMTAGNSTTFLGVVHPDGSFEVCEEAARNAQFTVNYLAAAELGELPDGMTYAYDWSGGFTNNTVTLNLEGVRLTDETVVESLKLPDGRTVPAPKSR